MTNDMTIADAIELLESHGFSVSYETDESADRSQDFLDTQELEDTIKYGIDEENHRYKRRDTTNGGDQ